VEDWAEIRRLHRAEGMPIKAIASPVGDRAEHGAPSVGRRRTAEVSAAGEGFGRGLLGRGGVGQQHHRRQTRLRHDHPREIWLIDILTQCAWSAARTHDTYLATQFWRLARRIGKKKAAVAVAHSILVISWHLFAVVEGRRRAGVATRPDDAEPAVLLLDLARVASAWSLVQISSARPSERPGRRSHLEQGRGPPDLAVPDVPAAHPPEDCLAVQLPRLVARQVRDDVLGEVPREATMRVGVVRGSHRHAESVSEHRLARQHRPRPTGAVAPAEGEVGWRLQVGDLLPPECPPDLDRDVPRLGHLPADLDQIPAIAETAALRRHARIIPKVGLDDPAEVGADP
jgi:hypothetical protein